MQREFEHNLLFVSWRTESKRICLKTEEFEEKLEELSSSRTVAASHTKRSDFMNGKTYSTCQSGYMQYIYLREDGQYVTYYGHRLDDKVNEAYQRGAHINEGIQSKKIVSRLFKEYNGVTEKSAFGYADRELLHKCVPHKLYYINQEYADKNLQHCSKADYCSNYPSNIKGILPDWHYHIEVAGTVKPTEDFPFAFYIKSGHVAEYNRFDTHDWLKIGIAIGSFDAEAQPFLNPAEDITILCKASAYRFDKVIDRLFEAKNAGADIYGLKAKKVLNSFIGCMHRKNVTINSYRLEHVAAVTIARAFDNMFKKVHKLDQIGIPVLQVIIDAIIYKGKAPIGVKDKYLGALVQEVLDADFRMRGINQYMFLDPKDGSLIEEKHAGLNDGIATTKLEDIKMWRRTGKWDQLKTQ